MIPGGCFEFIVVLAFFVFVYATGFIISGDNDTGVALGIVLAGLSILSVAIALVDGLSKIAEALSGNVEEEEEDDTKGAEGEK